MITKDSKFDRTSKYIFESLAKVMQAGASRTPAAWNHLKRYELEQHGDGVECFDINAALHSRAGN
jgi:hypothetical protein